MRRSIRSCEIDFRKAQILGAFPRGPDYLHNFYSHEDCRNNRSTAAYVQQVIRHARAAALDKPIQQLSYAYNNLDATLRPFVDRPTEQTTVRLFIEQLDAKREAWHEMAKAGRSSSLIPRQDLRTDIRYKD